MALLDFLKKKKEIEKSKQSDKKTAKVLPAKKQAKTDKNQDVKKENVEKTGQSSTKTSATVPGKFSYQAVRQPHISEKASYLSEKNQYTFDVSPNYNKNEIKKAVEGLYKVNVLSVNVIKIPAKKRRLGATEGFRKAYNKAVVKIKEGQKIEIL